MVTRRLLVALLPLALAACATTGTASKDKSPPPGQHVAAHPGPAYPPKLKASPYAPATEDLSKRGNYVAGGLYLPGVSDTVPDEIPDVDAIPEPEVRDEPRSLAGNRDYSVLGKRYKVMDDPEGYVETGLASYYGNKFHGRRTSSQEVYDMYAFSAAHKTLPLPSYARVTNLDNGRSIVVRINDRGPFHSGRVIDLSYAAAVKLGYRDKGTARVEVRALTTADIDTTLAGGPSPPEASVLDHLVDRLPEAKADASPVATVPARQETPELLVDAKATPVPVEADSEIVASALPTLVTGTSLAAASVPDSAASGDSVVLQVASYSDAGNAQHALALLQGAAIADARLLDADVNGQKIWRLRIGPVAPATATELAARLVGLGFSQPQRVRN